MSRILVVCTGNINRSPFAAAVLRRELPGPWEIDSAGFARAGQSAPARMVAAAAKHEIDLASHRSRGLSESDIDTADLVVCMDRTHLVRIASTSHRATSKCFTLHEANARLREAAGNLQTRVGIAAASRSAAEYVTPPYADIADPMGRSKRTYRFIADEIAGAATSLAQLLRAAAIECGES